MAKWGIKITGLEELDRKLKALPSKVQNKVVRQAMRQALKPVAEAVRDEAPVETGQTRAAVKVRAGRRRKGKITMVVQIGAGDYKGDTYYAAFVEFGYHDPKTGLLHPPNPFMKRAFNRTGQTAGETAARLIAQGIDAVVREAS